MWKKYSNGAVFQNFSYNNVVIVIYFLTQNRLQKIVFLEIFEEPGPRGRVGGGSSRKWPRARRDKTREPGGPQFFGGPGGDI